MLNQSNLCLDTVSACMSVGHLLLPASPTAWNSLSDDLHDPTPSTDSFRRLPILGCFQSTSTYSALYAIYKFTTYLQ